MTHPLRIPLAQLRSAGATLVLLGIVVALAAAIVVAAPIGVTHATSQELRTAIADLPDDRRDPTGEILDLTVIDLPIFASEPLTEEEAYGSLFSTLQEARESQPEPLRSSLGDAEIVIINEPVTVPAQTPEPADPLFRVRTVIDPLLDERVAIIEGRFPDPWVAGASALPPGTLVQPEPEAGQAAPVELVLTAEGADALRWSIGERRVDRVSAIDLLLVGIVEPVDADDPYWIGIPGAPESERFDDGNQQPRETAAAFVNPLSVGAPTAFGPIIVRYPLDVSRLDARSIDVFLPQLRAFVSTGVTVPLIVGDDSLSITATLSSDISAAADDVLDRASVTTAVLALMVAGPLGTLAVVLLLASRSTIDRRRSVLALQLARGASRTRLRWGVVVDSLLITVPATLVGAVASALLSGSLIGDSPSALIAGLLSPALVTALALIALVPAAMLASLVPRAADVRERRADLAGPGRVRQLAELVIIALAAVSVSLVLQRGIVTSASAVGADPLLAAMPLLVALAASAITVRVYPVLLTAVHRVIGRTGTAVSMIGSRRASRDRAVGVPVVVATVIAASVAVSSLSLLAVLDAGLDRSARDELGAAVRITGPAVSGELLTAVRELPEAAAAGGIDIVGPAVLGIDGVRENATVITIDDTTARLRSDAPSDWPPASPTAEGDRVPVMLSDDLLPDTDGLPAPDADIAVGGVPVTVVATGRVSAGFGAPSSWVLVGEADAELFASRPAIDTVIAEPAPGVSPAELGAALRDLTADVPVGDARVAIAESLAAEQRAVPLTAALRVTLSSAAVLAVALAITALAVAALVGRPRRQRVQALAHILGARRSASLVAWELAPPAILGTLVGGFVGVGLVPLATAAIDLRFVTGAADPVGASIDLALVGGVVTATLAAMIALIVIATAIDRRPPLLTALRTESP
ncbi:FtsX-like permease family protein [Microcella sp.]|uniref:FtsX-like permease family protein n=1 Tax=Microcella sp. TaxID=1913979 RepID=UPI003F708B01